MDSVDTPVKSDHVLELRSVSKSYGSTKVLENLSLTVGRGDFAVLSGMPSSGKSVVLRLVLGLEAPASGQVVLRGTDVTGEGPESRNIGYVPQSFALFPNKNVRDNITYPMRLDKAPKVAIGEALERVCTLLTITDLLDKRPDQLSGGQKQRVAIARGLAKETDFFVLDDPLVGLDFKLRERLIDDLRRTRAALNVTFLYSTSDTLESLLLATSVAILANGTVVEQGALADVYAEPRSADSLRGLGFPAANFFSGTLRRNAGEVHCETVFGDVQVALEGESIGDDVILGLRPEHVRLGESGPGTMTVDAQVDFTEDVGGSEILYLESAGTPLVTVLGSSSELLAAVGTGRVRASIVPEDLIVFDANTKARIGRGLGVGRG
jgi:ABC-type sugar transport system ATPase subunit